VHAALASMDIKTHQEEKLLQINNEEKNVVCFSTNSNLKYLCEILCELNRRVIAGVAC
jgi:hypothetical protein